MVLRDRTGGYPPDGSVAIPEVCAPFPIVHNLTKARAVPGSFRSTRTVGSAAALGTTNGVETTARNTICSLGIVLPN